MPVASRSALKVFPELEAPNRPTSNGTSARLPGLISKVLAISLLLVVVVTINKRFQTERARLERDLAVHVALPPLASAHAVRPQVERLLPQQLAAPPHRSAEP